MTPKSKKIVIIAVSICCIVTVLICLVFLLQRPEDRLSEAEIAALREEYPICNIDALAEIRTPSLEEMAPLVDSFVYGEVIQIETTAINERYYKYTLSVIDDTENKYAKGEEIVVSNTPPDYISFKPYLKEGMKVVMPVSKDDDRGGLHDCTLEGLYYVTEDGYAISAFDEEESKVTPSLSGLKVKQLFKELKKYRVVN